VPILPKDRDPRLITVRRGGSLTDDDHRLLAAWAALCAEHVLPLFARAAVPAAEAAQARRRERDWQRQRLPGVIRGLVLDDQRRRNGICWNAFDD